MTSGPSRHLRAATAGLLAAAVLATGCNLNTAGSPIGGIELTAAFDHVRNLVVGHAVRISDVRIGTVTGIELDGYTAIVTITIEKGRDIPTGTAALIRQTSLLGENFVELQLPERFDPETGPFFVTGDRLPETDALPELEDIVQNAAELLGGLAVNDLAALVNTAAETLGGRGNGINTLIARLSEVTAAYASQRGDLARVIDGFGQLGNDLAAGTDDLGAMLDAVSEATDSMTAQRQRMVDAVEEYTRFVKVFREVLFEGEDNLGKGLAALDKLLKVVADNKERLNNVFSSLKAFVLSISDAAIVELLNVYGWITPPRAPDAGA